MFVKLNNYMMKSCLRPIPPRQIAILASSCLQNSSCERDVVGDINNCAKCGKCNIKDILELKEEYGLGNVCIATGGTMAREFVRAENESKLVVAFACNRELLMGQLAVLPKKSYGICISRPNGPCRDTEFDPLVLREVLDQFAGEYDEELDKLPQILGLEEVSEQELLIHSE